MRQRIDCAQSGESEDSASEGGGLVSWVLRFQVPGSRFQVVRLSLCVLFSGWALVRRMVLRRGYYAQTESLAAILFFGQELSIWAENLRIVLFLGLRR